MRRFVVVGHRAITSAQFNLNDLCGSCGRLDVLLRCINSAFFLSHDFRRDVELYLVLLGEPDPPRTIRLKGDELKYLNPDERSTGALIRNALMKKVENKEGKEIMSTPGIYISKNGLKETLKKLSNISKFIYLREDGEEFNKAEATGDITFILSDDKNMTEDEEGEIQKFEPRICSLGATSYHSDHCICVISWLMDGNNQLS
jgi:tRNA (pseudouridine54-N1)-methyltransferase